LGADPEQFALLWPPLQRHRDRVLTLLNQELDRTLADGGGGATEAEKETLARRGSQAAVALLRFGQAGRIWPLFRQKADPRLRTYLIHRLGPLGADPRPLVRRLEKEEDVSARRA